MPCEAMELSKLAETVRKHQDRRLNEADTKAALVEPLLAWLGWHVLDLDEVRREWRRRPNDNPADYALFGEASPPLVLVEAKPLHDRLVGDKDWRQLATNALMAGTQWCLRTNGRRVIFVNSKGRGALEDNVFWELDLAEVDRVDGDSCQRALGLLRLASREAVISGETDRAWQGFDAHLRIHAAITEMISDPPSVIIKHIRTAAGGPAPSRELVADHLKRLVVPPLEPTVLQFAVTPSTPPRPRPARPKTGKGVKRAGTLSIGDETFTVSTAREALIGTANWLVDKGKIQDADCPVVAGRAAKRYLIHSSPLHPSGHRFFSPARLNNGLYLETHASRENLEQQARWLVRWAGYDDAMLRFEWR